MLEKNIADKFDNLENKINAKIDNSANSLSDRIIVLEKSQKSIRNYIILLIIAVIGAPLGRYFLNLP
jgi:hypothetical protein